MFGWFKKENKTNKEIAIEKFKKAGLTFEEADYLAQDVAELSLYADNKLFSNEEDNVHSIEEAYKDKYFMDTVNTITKDNLPIKDIAYTGIQARAMGLTFEKRTSLKYTVFEYLEKNSLDNSYFREIYMHTLEAINLEDDNIWIQDLWNWADENNIPDLEWVEIQDYVDKGWWRGIPREKEKLVALKALYLDHEQLLDFPIELCRLTNLVQLNLWDNLFNLVPKEIGNLVSLSYINLTRNMIEELPEEIGNLQNLTVLIISENQLLSLPKTIGKLINLEILELHYNKLKSLPKEIVYLTNLSSLYLLENQLSELPDGIENLKNLKTLNLSLNSFIEIPNEIFTLNNLTGLYLTLNQITNCSDQIGNLVSLVELNFRSNQIKNIPNSIGNLKKLTMLDFSKNQLERLPDEICLLKNLQVINLEDNPLVLTNNQRNWLKELKENGCEVYIDDTQDNLSITKEHENISEIDKNILNNEDIFIFDNGRSLVSIPGTESNLIRCLYEIIEDFTDKKLCIQKLFYNIKDSDKDIHFSIIGQKHLDYSGLENDVKNAKLVYEEKGSEGVCKSEIEVQPNIYIEWKFDFYQNDIYLESILYKNDTKIELYSKILKKGPFELLGIYEIFIDNSYQKALTTIGDNE